MSDPNATPPIKLYYEIHGKGEPLLCLHGFGASLYSWRNFVGPLSKDYQLILIDLKGAGKSPKPNDTLYSPFDHANLIYDFILEHNLRNLILIGNSFGGALSLLLSIMLAEKGESARLKSLVLIDAGAYKEYIPFYLSILSVPILNVAAAYLVPSKLAARSVLRQAYYDFSKVTKDQIAAYAAPLSAPGARHALLETGKQIIPKNIDELVAKYKDIKVPTLIIWGKQDKIISVKAGERLDQAIPNSTLKVIDQCGHVPQEEKPEETVPLVLEFLKSL
jgi:pimeloyl-ACP methyl ester carboxylesterase